MMAIIFPFGEGKTEKVVFDFLVSKCSYGQDFHEFISVGGKSGFPSKISETVESDLEAERDDVRILAFRDLDAGEQVDDVRESFQSIVWKLLEPWRLKPEVQPVLSDTVYKWEADTGSGHSELRFVLHIANHTGFNLPVSLLNQTTDGYILGLGLTDQVLDRFAQEGKVHSNPNTLYTLVTKAIPNAIVQNSITFDEDKDYLAAYLAATRFWVVRRTEEQTRLVKIILDRAWKYNQKQFERIFESWYVAIEEVLR